MKYVPIVAWAQDSSQIFLTIQLHDVSNENVAFDSNKVKFSGTAQDKDYEVEFETFEAINPDKSSMNKTDYRVYMTLVKSETDKPFWPRLLKERGSHHWLKVDFDKWQEESDEESQSQMQQMDFGGADFGDMGDDQDFSEDEEELVSDLTQDMDASIDMKQKLEDAQAEQELPSEQQPKVDQAKEANTSMDGKKVEEEQATQDK